jgi:hypothetical protein
MASARGRRQWRAVAFNYDGDALVSCGNDGEVLQLEGKKRGDVHTKIWAHDAWRWQLTK